LDRRRRKKASNSDWMSPSDPDAKITRMKDGRTHLAHKAEHAVDMSSGAIVAVTIQGADQGDTTTVQATLEQAEEQIETLLERTGACDVEGVQEVVTDKGYHSSQVLIDLEESGVRSYIAEPDRGRRKWGENIAAQQATYANRRRLRGARSRELHRLRGERIERTFAHLYETGRMRRVHLRGHDNILKRVLIHSGAYNLGLLLRRALGVGTPRGLQGRLRALLAWLIRLCQPSSSALQAFQVQVTVTTLRVRARLRHPFAIPIQLSRVAFTTGC
jgi:transposase